MTPNHKINDQSSLLIKFPPINNFEDFKNYSFEEDDIFDNDDLTRKSEIMEIQRTHKMKGLGAQ